MNALKSIEKTNPDYKQLYENLYRRMEEMNERNRQLEQWRTQDWRRIEQLIEENAELKAQLNANNS